MSNKWLWTIAVAVGMLGLLVGAVAADALVDVYVDGNKQSFDPGARLRAGTTYAPLRAAVDAVGASVQWVEAEQLAVVQKGEQTANINKSQGIIVTGRLLIPLRLMAEALQIQVTWDSACKAVLIGKQPPRVLEAAPDWVVGTWELYAISNSRAGWKIYDLSQGKGCAGWFTFNANGTWTGLLRSPTGSMTGSGTWAVHGDRYNLMGWPEPMTMFRQEKDLYHEVDFGEGNQAWLWFWPAVSPLDIRDPVVGTWQLWRISDTYGGPKDPVRDGSRTTFRFNADGTWSFQDISAGGSMTDSGTWTRRRDRYVLKDPAGIMAPPVFREGNTLYHLVGEAGGPRLYSWFRKQ